MIFNLLVLRADNPIDLMNFYQSLGLTFKIEKHGSGPEHYSNTQLGFTLEIYPLMKSQKTSGLRIGFFVENVEVFHLKAIGLGASNIQSPTIENNTIYATFKDPEGHIVTVEQIKPINT